MAQARWLLAAAEALPDWAAAELVRVMVWASLEKTADHSRTTAASDRKGIAHREPAGMEPVVKGPVRAVPQIGLGSKGFLHPARDWA